MSRRPRRTRAEELDAYRAIAKAAAELCAVLSMVEAQVHHFDYARKVILDGVSQLEQEQKAATAPAEPKA
jgi:hypothetical protein